jgi:hypothetical protein
MTTEPQQEHDLDQRLEEQREAGEVHRPLQVEATEDVHASVEQERRSLGQSDDGS